MLIGTAGHIDHGKTALVRALTGVDTTHLPEERKRGITIELGYAYAPILGVNDGVLAFIDVPGHERFVPTMLTGAAGIDFALLVVAADDGPMPQTREHLAILHLLGIRRGAVALTKCDRVDAARAGSAVAETESMLAGTSLEGVPVFRTSSVDGTGIDALRGHLCAIANSETKNAPEGLFRLAVDRHFAVTGAGTVVTGTVYAGEVHVGDRLMLARGDGFMRDVRVRGLHVSNRPAQCGRIGERCAINLVGIEHREVRRGDWLCASGPVRPSERLDVRLHLLPQAPCVLKQWRGVHAHHGVGQAQAHIALLDGALESGGLVPGGNALVQVVLDAPVLACCGDRIIIRDAAGRVTLGGGRVLDPFPPARHRRRPARLALLAALEQPTPTMRLQTLLDASPLGMDGNELAAAHNIGLSSWLASLPENSIVSVGGLKSVRLFAPSHWQALAQCIGECLKRHHMKFADEPGVERERLRRMCVPQLPSWVFLARLEKMREAGEICRAGAAWHLPAHRVELSPVDRARADDLLKLLDAGAFEPPWVRDLAAAVAVDEEEVRRLLRRIAARGEVFQIVRDLFYSARRVEELAVIVAGVARDSDENRIRAAVFRDRIGCGRKRAIQILEFFDRVGYTRRTGSGNERAHLIRGEAPVTSDASVRVE